MTNNGTRMDKLGMRIPSNLTSRIEKLELEYFRWPAEKKTRKIAAFDLDNTLLVGDIGEAVFIQLKRDERIAPVTVDETPIPFSWKEYEDLLKEGNKRDAYTRMVSALGGIPASVVTDTTERVMKCGQAFLEAEGVSVPVPYPNPVMYALVDYLYSLNYTIYIVSASHELSVRFVAKEYFGIPGNYVIGMRSQMTESKRNGTGNKAGPVLTAEVKEPLTVGEGKVHAYRNTVGSISPLITAGDSTTDIPLLNLTHHQGIIIWVGGDEETLEHVNRDITDPKNLYFLEQ
ncbi:MAG: hypothetical protein GY940_46730 [bacterium]|nr:hypothetical protein [bacterium]